MKKIILVAYDLNPRLGSESGSAYMWLQQISKHYFVEVFTSEIHKKDILAKKHSNVHFNFVQVNGPFAKIYKKLKLYNLSNSIFVKKIKPFIEEKKNHDTYSLLHCITPQGIHSYNDLYTLKIPYLVGPLGGGLKTAPGFKKIFRENKIRNFFRDAYYSQIVKNNKWKSYFINAKKIILGTPYVGELLPKEALKKTVIIFDTMIDIAKFHPAKKHGGSDVRICFVGRLEPQKGGSLLLDAFAPIAKKNKNVWLDLVGSGSQESLLKKQAKNLGIADKVHFLGRISRTQVMDVLNISDIFCLPTLREPGGGAILEAMACELPVITTNYGGPAYSVTKDCGIRIEPTHYDDYVKNLEKALLYLIENKKERVQMGRNGRKRIIAEFSTAAIEKKINLVYKEILRD